MFSDEDVKAAFETMAGRTDDGMETLRAIMIKTAELLAARGGTMDADELMLALAFVGNGNASRGRIRDAIRSHLSTQGARITALEEQLSAEREANREVVRRAQYAESEWGRAKQDADYWKAKAERLSAAVRAAACDCPKSGVAIIRMEP